MKRVLSVALTLLILTAVTTALPAVGAGVGAAASAAAATRLEVVWMGWPKDLLDEQLAPFLQANPDIELDIQAVPFNQLFQTLEVRLASSQPPDVFIVDGPLTASYAHRGYLMPLDSLIDEEELAEFFPASVEACKYRGVLYALPYTSSAAGLYFNIDIFNEYGVELPPQKPGDRITWEHVLELARRLTVDSNGDGQPEVWGLLIEQSDRPYQLLPLAESLGARPLSPDGSTSEGFVNSEAFIKAARFYGDLFNAEKVSPVGILDAPVVREYFGSGKAAMMLGAEWNISRLAEFEGFNFGLSAHPAFEGGRAVTPTGGWHVGISSRIPSDKLDAALHFARYMTSREASAAWARLFGNAPARRDAYEALPDLFSNYMWEVLLYDMEHTASPRPVTPAYLEFEARLKDAFNAIQFGADPTEALNEAARLIDRELARYR